MKVSKCRFILSLVALLLCFACFNNVIATAISAESKQKALSYYSFQLLTSEPQKSEVRTFDVSDGEKVAVGTERLDDKYVVIYSSSGKFMYAYKFKSSGSFSVGWNDENVKVHFYRAKQSVTLDEYGNILDVAEESSDYWIKKSMEKSRVVNGNTYELKNFFGFLKNVEILNTRITKTSADGRKVTIYDAGKGPLMARIANVVIAVIAVAVVLGVVISYSKERTGKDR